jgi:probable HAF family extracellular repeat protein
MIAITAGSFAALSRAGDYVTVVVMKAVGSLGVGAAILAMVALGCDSAGVRSPSETSSGFDGASETGADGSREAASVVGSAVLDGALAVHAYFWTSTGAMTDIGTLGGARGAAKAVNAAGKIVGDSTLASGDTHAFLWDGTMHDLGTLGGAFSSAAAINAAGDVVGVARTAAGADHAVLWHDGGIRDLGTLGGSRSEAVAINASGQVVGNSVTKIGFMHAFFWSNGVMQDVGDLGVMSTLIEARRPLNDAG